MRQRDQGCTHYTLGGITSFAVLQFATMLFHIAAAAMLTNIAVMDIYSFHELPNNIVDMQLLSDEVKPTKFNIFLNSSIIISLHYLAISIVLYIYTIFMFIQRYKFNTVHNLLHKHTSLSK